MGFDPAVVVEVGTSRVRALVGEVREDGNLMVTGIGDVPSRGVKKGEIVHLENAAACIRDALDQADRQSSVTIHSVNLVLSGGDIAWKVNRGSIPVMGPEYVITGEDIEHVLETAKAVSLPENREVIHTIKQHFYVDDHEGVIDPEGMEGAHLAADMLILHGVRNRLKQTVRAVRSVPVEIEDVAFSGLCSALACLTADQKESGVVLIDIGGGTTDYWVYANHTVSIGGTLAVGGDHITNDLAIGFGLPTRQAEKLKLTHGSAMIDYNARQKTVFLPAEGGFAGCSVYQNDVQTIIHARMEEIFELIRGELDKKKLVPILGAGAVLTGGGSHLREVKTLAEKTLGLRCMQGQPRNVSGLAVATEGPEYASLVGMLRYAFRGGERRDARAVPFVNLIRNLFQKS